MADKKVRGLELGKNKGNKQYRRPNFEITTILNAAKGDPEALKEVVNYYSPLIEKYSLRRKIDKNGKVFYEIDEDVRHELEITLIVALMTFDPNYKKAV